MSSPISRLRNFVRKAIAEANYQAPKTEAPSPFPLDVEGKWTLYEALQEPRTLSIEEILRQVRENVVLAKFCKKEGIPIDNSIDLHSSINNHLRDYNERNILNIFWGTYATLRESSVALNKDNNYWFYRKEFSDQILRENPELQRHQDYTPYSYHRIGGNRMK